MQIKKSLTLAAVAVLLVSLPAAAQMKWTQRYQDYIDQYRDIAVQEMLRYNIPASITLAQGLFESGAGQSDLCRKGNNHFGIKCHNWTGRTTYHDDDEAQECFRAYDSALDSYEDHSRFLRGSSRYAKLFKLSRTDYKGWAHGLKECGYATNPNYAHKLIEIIQLYRLHDLDKATGYAEHGTARQQQPPVSASSSLHPIHIYNKNYYLFAREGDTFKSIGEEVDISWRRLAKYNERDKRDVLHEGDIVYLKKKQTKALKAFKKKPHVVRPGESMYSIAQAYGIRLKSLYKKNHLEPDYQLRVGDKLKVY